ncbi:histidine kinase 3-like isoform X2 [Actinidia eriantha]|uniref:histidine kinase 3-like isoform X2 n=1 Tax=Actinidia eriantha TaxID=165200 RepID=UPI002583DDC7|nr:histidine kinase 3-like isoform X2 [Actinidia eriantha]
MSCFYVIGFGLKVGRLLLMLCCWFVSVISMNWFIIVGLMDSKRWLKLWDKILGNTCKIHHYYYQYIVGKKVRRTWWRKLLVIWVVLWTLGSFSMFCYMSSQAVEKRKETLASMCDERVRMLQDQFNVIMNHVQNMSILISTFHHEKNPSSIDQSSFAGYTERTAFERPLTSGVAYAVRVLHSEREQFEKQQGWTIKRMDTLEQTPVHKDEYSPEALEPSPIQKEYAPIIFAQDTISHVVSIDVLSCKEDRENVLRARASGKGVLTAPFPLLKSNRLGVVLTFAVYKTVLPSSATPEERIQATDGFKHKPPWPWLVIMTSIGILVMSFLIGHIFHSTVNRIAKVENDFREMMELKKRAEAADVAKSQFLATVSHEIRTPMNGVLGMLHMLMDTDLDVTQQDYVRTAHGSGKALISLINEVLDQAKIESGKLELEAVQFDLRAILDDVLSLFSRKSQERGVELAVYISDRVPEMLIGDPGRFRQIITNLMGNSIKFTEKGHIFVTVHLVEEVMESTEIETESSSENTLSGFTVADRWQSQGGFRIFSQDGPACPLSLLSSDLVNIIVSVEDTGVGIPLEAQSRVFTPFMQVGPSISRMHGGTGIGLSISKCLVGLMNGEIGFSSLPGIGSTFTFTAVLSNVSSNTGEHINQQINHQSNSASSEFQGMTALLVDPRPVRAKVSRYHIQRLGIHVEVVPNLNQGFSRIDSGNIVIDMVLIEQEIWDKDSGLSLFVDKLRNLDRGLPQKLFLLTNSISSTRSSFATSGVYTPTIIMKPLRASMLAASLQRAMGVGNQWNGHNGELPGPSVQKPLLGRNILVVDDNNVNLLVAAASLKKYGADVVCADSGKKAISLLKPPHKFDACFMDIQMPEMDGFEATKRIREMELNINNCIQHGELLAEPYENVSDWHVPIVAMTADVIQATHEECLRCGMDGYVSKPFETKQLYREVSRFFQTASSQNS